MNNNKIKNNKINLEKYQDKKSEIYIYIKQRKGENDILRSPGRLKPHKRISRDISLSENSNTR